MTYQPPWVQSKQLINLKDFGKVLRSNQLGSNPSTYQNQGISSVTFPPSSTSRLGCKWFHGAGAKAKAFTSFTLDDEGNICATVIANIPPKEWPVRINWHLTRRIRCFFSFFFPVKIVSKRRIRFFSCEGFFCCSLKIFHVVVVILQFQVPQHQI